MEKRTNKGLKMQISYYISFKLFINILILLLEITLTNEIYGSNIAHKSAVPISSI